MMRQKNLWRAMTAALLITLLVGLSPGCASDRRGTHGLDPTAPIDPRRDYHLVVWEHRLPFISPGGAPFAEAAGRAINRFRERYPNVTVDLVLLDVVDGERKLAEALNAGYPPDVYCTPYGPPAVGSQLQIPIGPYLDYDTWEDYHPVAWQAAKVGDVVWSWPRWLVLWPWLANATMLSGAGLETEEWTRESFSQLASALGEAGSVPRRSLVALGAPDPAVVVRDALFSAHLAAETTPAAAAFWSGAELAQALGWLEELRDAGRLDQDITGKNPGVMDSFVHGRTACLAPSSPWAAMFLAGMPGREDPWQFQVPSRDRRPEMVFVPPPSTGADLPPVTYLSAGQVLVFRQARYRGDDHTRLAVELAREVSREARTWLREHPLCVPVLADEVASWRKACERYGAVGTGVQALFDRVAGLPVDRLSRALNALDYGPWHPVPGRDGFAGAPEGGALSLTVPESPDYHGPVFGAVVAPLVRDFWQGDDSSQGLLQAIMSVLDVVSREDDKESQEDGQAGD